MMQHNVRYGTYLKEGTVINDNKKVSCKLKKIDLDNLNNFNFQREQLYGFTFVLREQNLNLDSGKKIFEFLKKLRKDNIHFFITRPLPRCLFGREYDRISSTFKIPKKCFECLELFTVKDDCMTYGCDIIQNRLGPKFEYMKDRFQIFDYFNTFLSELKPINKCKSCIYKLRKYCNALCYRKEVRK